MVKDPVCGIEVSIFPDTINSEYKEKIYYFCSIECKNKFLNNPTQYKSETTKKISSITNENKLDRDIRLFLGAICMALFLKTSGILKAVSAIFGLIFTITSITGFCLLYKLLNITPSSDIDSENRDKKDQNIFVEKDEVVAGTTDENFSAKR